MTEHHDHGLTEDHLHTGRIETLSDGVFSIVMTLLVLELHVPELLQNASTADFLHALGELWPRFLSFLLSFIVLGIFWTGHHMQFHYIKRSNRIFLWLNITFLFFISLVPFSAAFLGRYTHSHVSNIFYGANLICAGVALFLIWVYATSNDRLVGHHMSRELIIYARWLMLFAPGIYLVAVIASLWSTNISLWIYFLVPIYYIIPRRLDDYLPGGKKH